MPQKIKVIKSYRLTSKYANKGKRELVYQIFDWVRNTKNEMSEFVYYHLSDMLEQGSKFITNYKQWNSEYLPAHTIQTLFSDICNFYVNHINQVVRNITKELKLKDDRKYVIKLIRYLIKVSNLKPIKSEPIITNKNVQKLWNSLPDYRKKAIVRLTNKVISEVVKNINKIQFSNGSFRLTNTGCSFEIVKDEDNTKFKYFLKLKLKKPYVIYLPLLLEDEPTNLRTKQYFSKILNGELKKQILLNDRRLDTNSKKLFFAVVRDDELTFQEYGKVVGIDINLTKEKFLTCSNGISVGFDENALKSMIDYIVKYADKKGYNNLSTKEKKKISKLIKKNQWYLDFIIARLIDFLKENGVTDIVLEDLKPFNNGKFKIELFGYKLPLNRLVRFLRLSGLKDRFIQIAHNRGIRVHLTKSAYTSQQCPKCGHIDRRNRKSQSEFKCVNCGYECNADYNASINILLRYLFESYRNTLHKVNEFGELRPKRVKNLKNVLIDLFDANEVNKWLGDVLPAYNCWKFPSSGSSSVNYTNSLIKLYFVNSKA